MRKRVFVVVLLVLLVLIAVAGLSGAWIVFGPNTSEQADDRGVKIPPGSSFENVVTSLAEDGIIQSATTLRWFGRATGWGGQIKAGYYTIDPGSSNYDILSKLRRGLQSPVRITIPPGTRPEVIATLAGNVMYFDADEMLSALKDSTLAAELGVDTTSLFGYMLPESYDFYWLTSAEGVIRRIKQYADELFAQEIAEGAREMNLSMHEVVTLASIVEWETHVAEERPRVAGVYLNRLRIGMPLQADPTVQYAVMANEGAKRRLLFVDYEIESPYNTYRIGGLPPGPITNPSAASLRAVANAERHDYLYFVATGDGGHIFSRTFQEHVNAANRYRRLMQERRRAQQQSPDSNAE